MYITTVVFVGSEGNKTVEIEESTDEKYAKMKYSRALDRWFKILTHLDDDNIVHNMYRPQTLDILVNLDKKIENKLKFIKMYLNFCNKINNTDCSFYIQMRKGTCVIESESEDDNCCYNCDKLLKCNNDLKCDDCDRMTCEKCYKDFLDIGDYGDRCIYCYPRENDADDEKDDDSEHSETYEKWREKRNERRIEALLFGFVEE